jgi:hypothetical protein
MSKLKELEKRLRDEPDNLGLRVMVAGALHDAGRRDDAVELYRSVAIAYRDQGRPQQAITVCRSILELAPNDGPCTELLAALLASQPASREEPRPPARQPSPSPRLSPPPGRLSPPPGRLSPPPSVPRPSPLPLPRPSSPSQGELLGEPARRSSGDVTPLPQPLPYHLADPTSSSQPKLSRWDLPQSIQEELAAYPEIAGIANAARQISASLIAASHADEDADPLAEPDTGRVPRTGVRDRSASDPEQPPLGAGDGDDEPTIPPRGVAVPRARGDDETTEPREQPARTRPPSIAPSTTATGPLAGAFFAPVPPQNRTAVLQRFRRRMAAHGMTVIRRGESGHGLVLVLRGRLELHGERADGSRVMLGAIGPGDYVGEVSLLARAPASAQVVAAVESEILVLAAHDFYEITGAFPALWAELRSVAERRTREHAQRLRS